MSDSKTYVFGNDSNNAMWGMITPLLQQRGIDPNVLLAMRNNNGFGGEGSWFIWIFFLLILGFFNGNGFGNGNRTGATLAGDADLANLINNNDGRNLLMQAIQGNTSASERLSQTLGCSIGQIQQGIASLSTQVQNVGNQVGLSVPQIINSIQAGDNALASQIAKCCCDNQLAICQQTNTLTNSINSVAVGQERGFSNLAFETKSQTCDITKALAESTAKILAGQKDAEMRELQRDIAERDRLLSQKDVIINNAQQTTIFGQMIGQATTPIITAVNRLQSDVDGIKCKLPETTTVPYSPVVGVPNCVAAQYGLGFGDNIFNRWG